jgi:hypothetical protein
MLTSRYMPANSDQLDSNQLPVCNAPAPRLKFYFISGRTPAQPTVSRVFAFPESAACTVPIPYCAVRVLQRSVLLSNTCALYCRKQGRGGNSRVMTPVRKMSARSHFGVHPRRLSRMPFSTVFNWTHLDTSEHSFLGLCPKLASGWSSSPTALGVCNSAKVRAPAPVPPGTKTPRQGNRCTTVQAGGSS